MRFRRALTRSWYLIVIAVICGAAGGYFMYLHTTPTYGTSTTLAVGYSAENTPNDQAIAGPITVQRATLISQIAPTPVVVQAALDSAGVGQRAPQVYAASTGLNPLVTITIIDTDPHRAATIANSFKDILLAQLASVVGQNEPKLRLNVLAPAIAPSSPIGPSAPRDLGLGLACGLLLGLVAAFGREMLDASVPDSEAMAEISGLPILGSIPDIDRKVRLPAETDPRGVRAEAYRQVRTAITSLEPPVQVIAFTSATSGEGKTTVALNVATVMARAGLRVIVIDADLRRSMVGEVLDVPADFDGLAEVLQGRAKVNQAIAVAGEGTPDSMVAGEIPEDPSELLSGPRFGALIALLRERYDYIIIDTPPVIAVTDALVVAPHTDGVVLVGRIGYTTAAHVKRTMSGLERVNVKAIGVVPNCAHGGADRDYHYGYYRDDAKARPAEPAEPGESEA